MAKITLREVSNKKEWEDFLNKHPEANFLQSWNFGEFHENLGKKIQRSGFYNRGKLEGVMLSIVEPARRGKYLTVPGGPIINFKDKLLTKAFVVSIKKIAKENGCVYVRVRPQLLSNTFSKNLFKQLGFINAPIHLHAELTSQLELNKSEEELLLSMRKTTRHEIKKAISQGIRIEKTSNEDEIKRFYNLQINISKKKNFVPFSYKFLLEQFRAFAKDNQVLLISAKLGKNLLAQAFVIFYGSEAVYHYGATTLRGHRYPGAYIVQWEAIKEAKKRGMEKYNFWGVAPQDNKNHRFYSLSVFKRGFGGMEVEYLHAQDLVINWERYIINYLIEAVRKKTRGV